MCAEVIFKRLPEDRSMIRMGEGSISGQGKSLNVLFRRFGELGRERAY
jgi:hypothetical protein